MSVVGGGGKVSLNEELLKLVGRGSVDAPAEVRRVVVAGGDVHAVDGSGSTPLMLAARNNLPQSAAELLGLGANINHANNYGSTAAMFAASFGYGEVLSLLVSSRADLAMKNKNGYTALDYAQLYNKAGCIDIITR